MKIIIDGVFFQIYNTGIARVWKSLLVEWVKSNFAKYLVVLDRAGTAPSISGIRYRTVPAYDYNAIDIDREMLQQVCDEENADLFISTYYTTPLSTSSVFLAHDMIPELIGADLTHPMWREKHYSIQHASTYIAVSKNTARDLIKFFPHISIEAVTIAKNGIDHEVFSPADFEEIEQFKTKYGIQKPYFILVGARGGYKNTILFFKAFAQLHNKQGFEILCTGTSLSLEVELRNYTSGTTVHMLQLSDEELSIAYSGAVALVYPSNYEGFGLPVLESLACGCPVITCPNGAIPEVAGEAALYVFDNHINGMIAALCDVQKPDIRNSLIVSGLEQAKKFSWSRMAETISSVLIKTTLLALNLKDINLVVFPDWSQSEESLCAELEQVIKVIVTHLNNSKVTLLIDNGNIPDEEAALIISSVSINLLMQEDLNVSEGPEISFIGRLSEIQWEALLPCIQARIVLENENKQAIAVTKVETLPSCLLHSLSQEELSLSQAKPNKIYKPLVENRMKIFNSNKSNMRDMIYLGDYKALTKTVFGHKIVVDTRDISLSPHILLDGSWEIWMTRVFRESVKEGMTVIEIGANIGYYTILSAAWVGVEGRVYAFEANPSVFDTLCRNIAINGLIDRTTLVNKAVFNESKKLNFNTLKRYQGSSSIIKFSDEFLRHYMDEIETIEVNSISLDDFFADEQPKIDLIKIDAEGSEPCIFQGMTKIISCNPQLTIICEFAPQLISGMGENPRKFLQEITNYGFKLMKIDTNSELVSMSINDLLATPHCDLFLRR